MTRYIFQGVLRLTTPLHIGSGQANELTDSPIRTDTKGNPVVPGTALGGILRTQAERLAPALTYLGGKVCIGPNDSGKQACGCLVCQLFGEVKVPDDEADRGEEVQRPPLRDADGKRIPRPTRLVIRDAYLKDGTSNLATELRDGVGISRLRQTAGQNLKYDWEVLPRGAEFEFEAQLETREEATLQLWCATLAELVAGRLFLGGRSGRGTGRVALELREVRTADFAASDLSSLINYLKAAPQTRTAQLTRKAGDEFLKETLAELERNLKPENNQALARVNFVEVELALAFDYGLLINSPAWAILEGSDSVMVRTARLPKHNGAKQNTNPSENNHDTSEQAETTIYLPGSSLRGMLRAHAERIARTLSYDRAANEDKAKGAEVYQRYAEYLAACNPLAGKDEVEPGQKNPYAAVACAHFLRDYALRIRNEPALDRLKYLKVKPKTKEAPQGLMPEEIREFSCPACQLFGNTYLAGRLKVSDAYPVVETAFQELTETALPPEGDTARQLDFVAIDRFTGGARDSAKFDAKVQFPANGNHLEFRCTLSLRDLDPETEQWMPGWLGYVLRDLMQGELRLGMGKAKGLGQVYGRLLSLTVGSLSSNFPLLQGAERKNSLFRQRRFEGSELAGLENGKTLLTQSAQAFNDKVKEYERSLPPVGKGAANA